MDLTFKKDKNFAELKDRKLSLLFLRGERGEGTGERGEGRHTFASLCVVGFSESALPSSCPGIPSGTRIAHQVLSANITINKYNKTNNESNEITQNNKP